jgi:lactate dehydrogenase-like 2-hydroxyacid dehydrogenase
MPTPVPCIRSYVPLQPLVVERLAADGVPIGFAPEPADYDVEIVVTNGTRGLTADEIAALPALRLVMCSGAGYEGVDLDACRASGIAVTHLPGANNSTVADHALGLMLALARDIPGRHQGVAAGEWESLRKPRPTLSGSTLGLVGLGGIGRKIARRAEAFEMRVLYSARHEHADAPHAFYGSVEALARESDFLVLACPGGPATHHLVDAQVLTAIGSDGFLVNVARGSVVATEDLIAALDAGVIAGAALDVCEGEPVPALAIRTHPRVIMTPHMAGRSPAAVATQAAMMREIVSSCRLGAPIPYRVDRGAPIALAS